MKNEIMYLSLLTKLDEAHRFAFQSELCSLRDSIAEQRSVSIQEVQDDLESMVRCVKYNFMLGELEVKYPEIRVWIKAYRRQRGL